MNNCFTEAIAFDSTTLAVYFQQGLTRKISTALVNSQSIATIQNLALVMAAVEKIESKFDMSVKQAMQVEVPASGNPTSNKRSRYNMGGGNTNSFNNISTNNCGGDKGPFNAGRGNAARGRGTHARGGGRGRGSPLANHLTLLLTRIYIAQLAMPLGTPNGSAPLSIVK